MNETEVIVERFGISPDWWTFIVLGILAVIFGIVTLMATPFVVLFLGYFVGAAILIYGVMLLIQGFQCKQGAGMMAVLAILGILCIILGILIFTSILTAWFLITYLIAFWAFLVGLNNLWGGFSSHDSTLFRILHVIAGLIALTLGVLILAFPLLGTAFMMMIFAAFAIAWGLVMIVTGFVFKRELS